MDFNESEPEAVSRRLATAFRGILSWKWDDYIDTVLAKFDTGDKDSIREILERYLGSTWDASNIAKAPDIVQTVNNNLGGLRPEQLLYTSDPEQVAIIFGAWWPWGDGKTISIRIAPAYGMLSYSEKELKFKRFRGLFGI